MEAPNANTRGRADAVQPYLLNTKARLTGDEAGKGENKKTSNTGKQSREAQARNLQSKKHGNIQNHRSKDTL